MHYIDLCVITTFRGFLISYDPEIASKERSPEIYPWLKYSHLPPHPQDIGCAPPSDQKGCGSQKITSTGEKR